MSQGRSGEDLCGVIALENWNMEPFRYESCGLWLIFIHFFCIYEIREKKINRKNEQMTDSHSSDAMTEVEKLLEEAWEALYNPQRFKTAPVQQINKSTNRHDSVTKLSENCEHLESKVIDIRYYLNDRPQGFE